jgi:hypothetical protein
LRAAQAGQRIGGSEQGTWRLGPQRLQRLLDVSVLQAADEPAQQPPDQAVEDDRAEHDRRDLERPGHQQLTHAGNQTTRVNQTSLAGITATTSGWPGAGPTHGQLPSGRR